MKIIIPAVAFLIAVSGATVPGAQKLYTWIDAQGVTHITDEPPPKKARVEDVTSYSEKSPQEIDAIERKKQQLREQYERFEKRNAAQKAAIAAREAQEQAQEAMQNAQEETEQNQEYVRRLSSTKNKRKQFRKKIQRIKNETAAAQAEAGTAEQEAEAAAKKAQQAAAEASEAQ